MFDSVIMSEEDWFSDDCPERRNSSDAAPYPNDAARPGSSIRSGSQK